MPDSYIDMQEDLEKDSGHSLVLVLRKRSTLSKKTVHKELCEKIAEKILLEFAESGCPSFRSETPLSRSQLKNFHERERGDLL